MSTVAGAVVINLFEPHVRQQGHPIEKTNVLCNVTVITP